MAISVSAAVNNAATGSSTTLALASVVMAAGDRIMVAMRWRPLTATVSLSDGVNSFLQVGGYSNDDADRMAMFEAINVASGTRTVTATFSASSTFRYASSVKVSGSDANPAQAVVFTSNKDGTWTSATDNMASGSLTPTGQPAGVIGWGGTIYNGRSIAAGTGYTDLGALSAWDSANGDTSRLEWKRVTSTVNSPVTFTLSGSEGGFVWGVVVGEAAAGGGATRGTPFGHRGTAFNGGRTFHGILARTNAAYARRRWKTNPGGRVLIAA
jgi:hypothetical protein